MGVSLLGHKTINHPSDTQNTIRSICLMIQIIGETNNDVFSCPWLRHVFTTTIFHIITYLYITKCTNIHTYISKVNIPNQPITTLRTCHVIEIVLSQCCLSFIFVFFKYHDNDGAVSFQSSQSNVCIHTYEQNRCIRRPVDRLIAHDPGYYQLIIVMQHDKMDMG